MDWANGSKRKQPASAPSLGIVLGLTFCAAGAGCAQLPAFRKEPSPPPAALSALEPGGAKDKDEKDARAQAHKAYRPGQLTGKLLTALRLRPAGDRASASAPALTNRAASPARNLAVALQPPVPVARGQAPSAVAAAPATPDAVPAAAVASALPGPVEATANTPAASRSIRPASEKAAGPATDERAGPSLESIVADARARLDAMASYQVELNRQERVAGVLLEPEDVLLSIRREPKAVRLEWEDGPHKGREVLYADGEKGGLMHINMADAVVPARLTMAPDSPIVLKSSRHPITEAGFDTIIANIENTLAPPNTGETSRGRLTYAGLENPGALERPCHKVVRITPSGETWIVYLDPVSKLPAMVEATDAQGELLERYRFHDVRPNVAELASAGAFDPNQRWGPPKGLLGRLARARSALDSESDSATH